jgi:hypothetical protein
MKNGNVIKLFVAVLLVNFTIGSLLAQKPLPNMQPCLFDGIIEPISGIAKMAYIASVHYYDPDGRKPLNIQVFVDEIGYTLKLSTGQFNDGIYKAKLTLPPAVHSYYFYAEDDYGKPTRYPRYGAKTGPLVGIKIPYLKPAQLSNGGLLQSIGTDKTFYTYTVNYKDPQYGPPQKIFVIVDGIMYPMALHKGQAENGTYIAILTLPAGKHAYYFKAMDFAGYCISLPEKGFIRGPQVSETFNNSPRLIDAKLEPGIGYSSNNYTYYVTYLDDDSDSPSIINVVIDGETYPLKLQQGKSDNGVYSFRTKNYIGYYHNYYFYCEDGRGGSCRTPEVGTYHGPVVVR